MGFSQFSMSTLYCSLQLDSPLWELTCNMGSHSVDDDDDDET